MTVRILSAAADPDTARTLTGLLGQLPATDPGEVLPDTTALLDALARAGENGLDQLPEVVLVHERVTPMPALDLVRQIALRFPAVGVVLMTSDPSPALYAAAMESGARSVVGLPLAYDELAARVDAAAAWSVGVRRHLSPGRELPGGAGARPGGTLIAVAGAKGGTGTTVSAVQLALAAHAAGRSTALVDMDLQAGDVASYLDVQFRRSIADLADIGEITGRVLQDAMYVHPSGLALLLAPADGERGEDVTDRSARQLLHALRGRFDVVVVDCGTQMTNANAVAVETAETAVLVTTPDVVAVRAAKRMVRLWDRLQIRKPEDVIVTVNRHTRASEIQPSLIMRITGTRVARTVVPAAFKELQGVIDAGRLQDLDNRSGVKQALWALAAELGITGTADVPATPPAQARRRRRELAKGDQGQVALEFLGMTPVILVVLVLIWQAVLAGYTFTLAGNAADEAARAAAVGNDARAAALADLPGAWRGDAQVDPVATGGGLVSVTVGLKVPVLFPGAVDFPLTVHGHAAAADEQDTR
ncbi:AAA family ATPase [Streptomyces sp. RB6PN25]|uniref:AAA family ATPase n=1 Tax=Streptomyces humicola TaxID=2953240 RepID=A0ABT1Q0G0_9ACTN|nr:AAA family ATPase [Streptomyces humicola]MCQ4082252.1 AAA family ATPase [Streptomyces humicola]